MIPQHNAKKNLETLKQNKNLQNQTKNLKLRQNIKKNGGFPNSFGRVSENMSKLEARLHALNGSL